MRWVVLKEKRIHIAVMFILVVAALVRFSYLNEVIVDDAVRGDAIEYYSIAYNLHHFGVYSSVLTDGATPIPDAKRTPGYPLFLYSILRSSASFDYFVKTVYLAQAILSIFTVLLVFQLARQFVGYGMSVAISILVAINPHIVALEANMLSETLFTFSLMVSLLIHERAIRTSSFAYYAMAGGMYGIAAVVRPSAVLLVPFIVCCYLILLAIRDREKLVSSFKYLVVFGFVFLLAQTPFAIRNTITFGAPFMESDRAWDNILLGTYPEFTHEGGIYGYPSRDDPLYKEMFEDKGRALEILLDRVKASPAEYAAWYSYGKLWGMWQWDTSPGGAADVYVYPLKRYPFRSDLMLFNLRKVMSFLHVPLVITGLLGAAISMGKLWNNPVSSGSWFVLLVLILYYVAMLEILFPIPRLTIPLRPVLYIFSGLFVCQLVDIVKNLIFKYTHSDPDSEKSSID